MEPQDVEQCDRNSPKQRAGKENKMERKLRGRKAATSLARSPTYGRQFVCERTLLMLLLYSQHKIDNVNILINAV
jgi:hypothetical protein